MQHKSEYLDLRLCDNMELMAQYPDKHFELAICDPEYGIGAHAPQGNGLKITNRVINKKWCGGDWDKAKPTQSYFNELIRVSKNQIVWGGNYFTHLLPQSDKWLVWDKMQRIDQSNCELAWTSFKGALRVYQYHSSKLKGFQNPNRFHPTEKPVSLYKWLLDEHAKAGDKILDTHLGSGSIAIACHDYKYHLTACELDSDYFAAMQTRVENHLKQTTILF